VLADGGGADVRGDVLRDALLLEVRQVLGEGRPGDVVLEIALVVLHLPLHRVGERPHRRALAEDLRRHALADLALRAAVDQQRFRRPRQHVDEAGRHRQAARVHHHVAWQRRHLPDRFHPVATDRDVGDAARRAGAVVHGPAADDRAGRLGRGGEGGRRYGEHAESEAAHVLQVPFEGRKRHVNVPGRFRLQRNGSTDRATRE
jgi:hypothetical protein